MDASAYRQPGEIPPPDDKLDHAMLDRVLLAVNATFRSAEFSPLSHYQDHVQYRWATNLRRALNGCDEFIWADQSWGFRYDMMRMPWWKFLWKTRKMPLADRLMWASDRLRRRQEIRALPARSLGYADRDVSDVPYGAHKQRPFDNPPDDLNQNKRDPMAMTDVYFPSAEDE